MAKDHQGLMIRRRVTTPLASAAGTLYVNRRLHLALHHLGQPDVPSDSEISARLQLASTKHQIRTPACGTTRHGVPTEIMVERGLFANTVGITASVDLPGIAPRVRAYHKRCLKLAIVGRLSGSAREPFSQPCRSLNSLPKLAELVLTSAAQQTAICIATAEGSCQIAMQSLFESNQR